MKQTMTSNHFNHLKIQYINCLLLLIVLVPVDCIGGDKYNLDESHHDNETIQTIQSKEVSKLTDDEESLVEYFVNSLFEDKRSALNNINIKFTYFIKVLGGDPPRYFLDKFKDEKVKIKPASECRYKNQIVYDQDSYSAEVYSIYAIEINDVTATVKVSFAVSASDVILYTYHLIRLQGKWKIVKTTDIFMS